MVDDVVEHVVGYDEWADLVTCFELLEHVHAPLEFLKTVMTLVRPGGYVCIRTLCVDGFDLQMLRENQRRFPHLITLTSCPCVASKHGSHGRVWRT